MHPQPIDGPHANAPSTLTFVPNQPKTGNRVFRAPKDLWDRFGKLCEVETTDRAKDLRAYMERRVVEYEAKHGPLLPDADDQPDS
jgi:hypothetical protein